MHDSEGTGWPGKASQRFDSVWRCGSGRRLLAQLSDFVPHRIRGALGLVVMGQLGDGSCCVERESAFLGIHKHPGSFSEKER